jgi:hypothetical protein
MQLADMFHSGNDLSTGHEGTQGEEFSSRSQPLERHTVSNWKYDRPEHCTGQ